MVGTVLLQIQVRDPVSFHPMIPSSSIHDSQHSPEFCLSILHSKNEEVKCLQFTYGRLEDIIQLQHGREMRLEDQFPPDNM